VVGGLAEGEAVGQIRPKGYLSHVRVEGNGGAEENVVYHIEDDQQRKPADKCVSREDKYQKKGAACQNRPLPPFFYYMSHGSIGIGGDQTGNKEEDGNGGYMQVMICHQKENSEGAEDVPPASP